ncbi:MAG TPA: hypothetical protein VFC05_16010 [Nitrososphaeraceae archaeon]|nr:hypothetical protein [Nitrososphaeraceae archaeon]
MRLDTVLPKETFGGLSYGEWAAEWTKWLHSEDPDTYEGGNVLFLRGNVDYRPTGIVGESPRFVNPKAIYDRTGQKGETIFEGTAIFIPVITTSLFIGDVYEGKIIKNEQELRYIVNKDTDETRKMWAVIKRKADKKASKLVKDLKAFRFESPLFRLIIPKNSFLRERMEMPVKPGIYDAITTGYFIMIRGLHASKYRIIFGGEGMGAYATNSVYDIYVRKKRMERLIDSSDSVLTSKYLRLVKF